MKMLLVALVALLGSTESVKHRPAGPDVCLPRTNEDAFWVDSVACEVDGCQKSHYIFSESKATWEEARRECEKNNMELATVFSKDEDEYLRQQILLHAKGKDTKDPENPNRYSNMYWIGGRTNSKASKDWVWPRPGLPMSVTKDQADGWGWAVDRPNEFKNQFCVVYYSEKDPTKIDGWDNDKCGKKVHYICESIPRCTRYGKVVSKCKA